MPHRPPSRLALALASLHPIAGGLGEAERGRRALRLVTVLVAALVPAFGVVLHLTDPDAVDPWEGRAAWTLAALGVLGLSYVWGPVRRHASRVLTLMAYGVIGYFAALAYLNGLRPSYATGFLFVYVSAAMAYCFAFNRIGPLALCLPVSIGAAAAVAVAVPEPGMNPVLFVLYAACLGVIILLAVLVRLRAEQELANSEASLAEAERLACVGHWAHDLRTGERRWSAGLYRLVGLEARPGTPPHRFDFTHPDDLPRVRRQEALLGQEDTLDHQFRIVRADGAVRTVHSTVRVHRDWTGKPLRYHGAVVDVTEQAEREAALERARAAAEEARVAAEEAARLKASILANMSHEIRTPITAVIGYAQVLAEEVTDEHRALVEPIERGGRRLMDTLNSVLDLARLEAGGPALTCHPTDAVAEAEEVARLLHGRAAAKGIVLHVAASERPALALADGSALHRVLMNLVGNAVKFTERGEVVVRIRTEGARVRVEVADTGRGIAAAFLPRLFDAFRQESHGDDRSHEGTGLGLAITRRLVEAMGGEIGAESVQGRGSVFTVTLPAAPAAAGDGGPHGAGAPAWTSAAPAAQAA